MLATRPTGKKILIVEDDYILGEALSLALAAEGYMVAIAANGQDALDKLRGLERPHLILMDLMLPEMSGWQLRDRLRQDPALASIPVIICSAAADLEKDANALDVACYVQKPIETSELLRAIKGHCR